MLLRKYKVGCGVWIVAILLVCACSCLTSSKIKFVLLGHGDVVWKIMGENGTWEFGAKLEKSNSF